VFSTLYVLVNVRGSFSVAEKSARKGVNPKTKQPIEIPARKSVKFKAGAELNELIK
jgi:DNA-binding protein HU-beta